MGSTVKFKLSDLPPHLRSQAERQIMTVRGARAKCPPKTRSAQPIRMPREATPNRTEARYLADHPGGLYEALTFRVASGRYTPDFVYFRPDGSIVAVEVKGPYALGSQAAASAKFKEAVAAYPQVGWVWAKWADGFWQCGYYGTARVGARGPDDPPITPRAPAPVRD